MRGTSRTSMAAAQDQLEALLSQPTGPIRSLLSKVVSTLTGSGHPTPAESDDPTPAESDGPTPAESGDPPSTATTLGEELFAVARLLDSRASLRRALTDPSREGEAKAQLIQRLLRDQVSEPTLDLVSGLVRARWSSARDLADACEHLGATALVVSAEREGRLDAVEDELFRFGRIVAGNPDLRAVLSDRSVPASNKDDLVVRLLDRKVAPQTLRLASQAVAHPRGRRLEAALEAYAQVAAERRERLVADVVAAVPLTQEQRERLEVALVRLYGHQVQLNVDVDPAVIGGLRLQVGDEVIDSTVLTRLADARRRLAG